MSMQDWKTKLDAFLTFNEYEILNNLGTVKRSVADHIAMTEYEKYRIVQDENYTSDFDELLEKDIFKSK